MNLLEDTSNATTLNIPEIGNRNNVRRRTSDGLYYQVTYLGGKTGNELHLCQFSDLIHWSDLGVIGGGTGRLL